MNGKIYIGLSKNIQNRLRGHKSSKKDNNRIARAIRKYGWNNFEVEILELLEDLSKLEERETFYIKQFDSTNREKGYNILEKNLCKYSSDLPTETRKRMSDSAKRRYEENPDWKLKSAERIEKSLLSKIRKKVAQLDKETGEIIKIWDCMQEASNELKITRESISRCANKTIIKDRYKRPYVLPSAGGYKWELIK